MKNNSHIAILIVAYKDKNLFDFVTRLRKNTVSSHSIEVFDQHPINHEKEFSQISDCSYDHKIWDDIAGPTIKRTEKIHNRMHNADYICVLSPDITLNYGWDLNLISFIKDDNKVVSGSGSISINHNDLFSIKPTYTPSDVFSKTEFADKNFIFAKSETFHDIRMPDFLKYFGEDEYWTLSFISQGYEIYSAPQSIYFDNRYRSVENTYHTFSSEHNYNIVVDILHKINNAEYKISNEAIDYFFRFHDLDPDKIHRLPYQTNDVDYDPYNLAMHDVDARRFIAGTKAVY